ncbi:MAG: type I-U CRISPR-associated protein Csx17 [Planctomycetota bacterium]|nr:type I-U CRISPR-associated protein Csx17 [Planctomycetota bacterium]
MTTRSIQKHELAGCAPSPLAHYLKGLGVLRLVAEQADPNARGAWRDERFVLWTRLDREALLEFFLVRYAPTPMLTPWNGGSGFYPNDNRSGFQPIAESKAPRFEAYAQAIAQTISLVAGAEAAPKEEAKAELLTRARATWRGGVLEWLTAATVLSADGQPRYPALLGTGGNDGRLDYTNNFMQRLVDLFDPATGSPRPTARAWLEASLEGTPGAGLLDSAIGQFMPGAAGGVNGAAGFSGKAQVNPWDFVLMLEGATLLRVASVRRLDSSELPQAAAPFAVRSVAAGYGSATDADATSRGEIWLPLWPRPSSLQEVRALFREGRLQSGSGRATRAVDAARAVARLGVDRGVQAFERFGFLERLGQSNLAVPIGRWSVRWKAAPPRVRLLDELDEWIDRLRRAASDRTAPASFGRLARRLDDDVLALCRDDSPDRWENLLRSLAVTEDELARRGRTTAERGLNPLPPLSSGWLEVLRFDDPEVRLAVALASAGTPSWVQRSERRELGAIRAHCLPLEGPPWAPRFDRGEAGLRKSPRVVWRSASLWEDLSAVVLRRAVESKQHGLGYLALSPVVAPRLEDLAVLAFGRLDGARVAELGRALMALRWDEIGSSSMPAFDRSTDGSTDDRDVPAILLLLLLACPARAELSVRRQEGDLRLDLPTLDTATLRLLHGGRVGEAVDRATRRLRAAGVSVKLGRGAGGPELGRRLLAALALSPGERALARAFRQISRPQVPPAPAGAHEE